MNNYDFSGKHFIATYINCNHEALINLKALANALEEAIKASKASILQFAQHIFPENGLTVVVLLSESHASIHTYPEYDSCFIDLFTCGDKCDHTAFDKHLQAYLKPVDVKSGLFCR
jgi:S-adenosylmethionine decarboxylase